MSQGLGLRIDPLDVLFFRDNRPFEVGMRGIGSLPLPQTLAGALRTHLWHHLGLDFGDLAARMKQGYVSGDDVAPIVATLLAPEHAWAAHIKVRGPWLYATAAPNHFQETGPLVPVPADLAIQGKKGEGGEIVRLYPRQHPPPGWRAPQPGMVPLWCNDDFERAQGYLTLSGLCRYLDGETPDKLLTSQALYDWEDRVGIAVDADRNSAADHMLYAVRLLRLHRYVSFYAEVEVDENHADEARQWLQGTLAFGGEGRRAQVTVLPQSITWPQPPTIGDRTLALLLTPGIFGLQPSSPSDAPLWRPDRADLPALIAAAVPGFRPVSGWDLARNHAKPTRFAILEGSVYCFDGTVPESPGSPFLHLHQGELDALGYGLALKGVWKYAQSR